MSRTTRIILAILILAILALAYGWYQAAQQPPQRLLQPELERMERAEHAKIDSLQKRTREAEAEAAKYRALADSLSRKRATIITKYEKVSTKPVPAADSLTRYFAGYRSPFER